MDRPPKHRDRVAGPRTLVRASAAISIVLFWSGLPGSAPAWPQSRAEEYGLKAAFLFHFAQLVDWPADGVASGSDPLTLCTLGEDRYHVELKAAVEGKLAGTRPLQVRHLKLAVDTQGCQVLFMGGGDRASVPVLLAKLNNAPILTVGETADFVRQGGMIGFCLEGKKVRFEINLDAAQRAGLKISSRLLLLAKSVIGTHG